MSAPPVRLAMLAVLLALVTAPACGGGGGSSSSGPGGSPSPLAASFVPDQPSPGAKTAAMAQGANSNDIVTVNVTLTGINGVFGTAFEVVFDDTHTGYVGYTAGTIVEQGDNNPTYSVGTSAAGRLVIVASHTGSTTTNVPGTSTIIGLQFRVKQAGVYPMAIQNAVVYDGQSTPQPIPGVTWYAGAVSGT
jgi:Cohesin domain